MILTLILQDRSYITFILQMGKTEAQYNTPSKCQKEFSPWSGLLEYTILSLIITYSTAFH